MYATCGAKSHLGSEYKPMSRFRAIPILVPVLLSLSLAWPARAVPPEPEPSPKIPDAGGKLAVVVVVDGLGADALERWRPWLSNGFARLLREGRVERNSRFGHLNTETSPGHATIATGVPPRVHGIVLNQWWESTPTGALTRVPSLAQPEGPGASRMRVPTLADRLRELAPGSRVISLSGKDRSAVFLAGRNPHHAVAWFSPKTASFITSKAYRSGSPEQSSLDRALARLAPVFGEEGLTKRYGAVWRPLPVPPGTSHPKPAALRAAYQDPVVGIGFDHEIRRPGRSFGEAFQRTPFQDALLADLVLTLLNDPELAMGRRGAEDLLLLSFSAHDYVAHAYGAESEEALEALRHLDATLGRLLDALDAALPSERLVVVLTADHGFAPIPEAATPAGARLAPKPFVAALNAALARRLCLAPGAAPVGAIAGWGLYYDRSGLPLKTVEGRCGKAGRPVGVVQFDEAIVPAVKETAGGIVAAVLPVGRTATWKVAPEIRAAVHEATFPGRSADVFLIPAPGTIVDEVEGKGANHGSSYDCDAHVPMIFRGGTFPAGTADAPTSPAAIAPALAEWLGITIPGRLDPAGVSLELEPPGPR